MREVTIQNWGTVNPVQFKRSVTPQTANDLAEIGRKLRLIEDQMLELSGGQSGRDFTDKERRAFNDIRKATQATASTLISVNDVLGENVVMPTHDGGPDVVDGAVSNGVLV